MGSTRVFLVEIGGDELEKVSGASSAQLIIGKVRYTIDSLLNSTYYSYMLRIAIDIGGTFTDVVAQTHVEFVSVKVLTHALHPELGALEGVERLLQTLSKGYSDITGVVHGTTLATNALIERRGARTAFVTTAGFRDVLEMRYEKRFDQYALNIEFPEPLVPRPWRLGLAERILADGTIKQAPIKEDIDRLADLLQEQRIEAVAIGFLHAYKNPDHELMVAEQLARQLDSGVTICQSAEVAGEIREFERFSTVCANAYVRPLMGRYLDQLLLQLRSKGFKGSFLMMLSDGALTTLDKAMRFPIRLVEGGPAGGVALAAHVAKETGSDKTLALDIGGTTAKICFIEKGKPKIVRRFEIAREWLGMKGSGLPVRVPTVELVEIGAGGGSIASVDTLERLRIGPRSARASPGPAAYDQGGEEATLTDAHIALGNLATEGFANGMISLKPARAQKAIAKNIQLPLAFDSVSAAAAGIVELADENLANAARVHGVEQGLDAASFDLLVSGGGGALHGVRIAEKLGMRRVVVPVNAGVGSAVGFLHSPVAFESALSILEPLAEIDTEHLADRLGRMQQKVHAIVADAVQEDELIRDTVTAELRYVGQGLELSFTLGEHDAFEQSLKTLAHDFTRRYRELHGFVLDDIAIELVTLSVNATELRATVPSVPPTSDATIQTTQLKRSIHSLKTGQVRDFAVMSRQSIGNSSISGPIVIPESQTTTLVPEGWKVKCSTHGHLILDKADT